VPAAFRAFSGGDPAASSGADPLPAGAPGTLADVLTWMRSVPQLSGVAEG
jgi:hypothetical protein